MRHRAITVGLALLVLCSCTATSTDPDTRGSVDASDGAADVEPITMDVDGLAPTPVSSELSDEQHSSAPAGRPTLYELVTRGADDDRWSLAEGTGHALRWVAGLVDDGTLDEAVGGHETELTGLLSVARELIADPATDGDARAVLEQSIRVLAPTQAALDAVSAPAEDVLGAAARIGDPTLVAASDMIAAAEPGSVVELSVACTDAAGEGLETADLGGDETCYLWVERRVEGNRLRVYYPRAWGEDEDKQELPRRLLDAMDISTQAFSEYGEVGDVNLAISLLDDAEESAGWMYNDPSADVCQTVISPTGIAAGVEAAEQTIAHEIFHCVQDRNFDTQPHAAHRWWTEGTAEFFSNVAFPSNQDEHARASDFRTRSLRETPFDMSYENTVWFQHLANELGVEGLWDLLGRVTPGGASAAPSALAAEPGMAQRWHDFVVFLNSRTVMDTAGGPLPVGGPSVSVMEEIDEPDTFEHEMQPWVAGRIGLRYAEARTFDQGFELEGDGAFSVVERPNALDPGAYGTPPDEVFTSCGAARVYAVVLTTIEEEVSLEVTIDEVDRAVCDGCVVGDWELDVERFGTNLLRTMEQQGGPTQGVTVSGSGSMTLAADGAFSWQRDVQFNFPQGHSSPFGTKGGGGEYEADGEIITLPGESGPRSSPYTCDLEELLILETEIGEQRWVRVFDDLEPDGRTPPEPEPVEIFTPSG